MSARSESGASSTSSFELVSPVHSAAGSPRGSPAPHAAAALGLEAPPCLRDSSTGSADSFELVAARTPSSEYAALLDSPLLNDASLLEERKESASPLSSTLSLLGEEPEALLLASECDDSDDDVPDISEAVEAALRAQAEQEEKQDEFDAEGPQPEQEEEDVWYDDRAAEYDADDYSFGPQGSAAVQLKQRDQSAMGTRCTLNSQRTRKQQKAEQHAALVHMRAVRSQVRAEQRAAAASAQQPSALHPLRAVNRKAQRAAAAATIAAAHTPALLSARALSPSARSKGQQRRVDAAAATPREITRQQRHAAQAARSAVKAARKLPSLVTECGDAAEEAAARRQRQRAKSQQHRAANPLLRADRQVLPSQDRGTYMLHHAAAPAVHASRYFRRHFSQHYPTLQQLRAVSHELQAAVQSKMAEHVADPRVTSLLSTASPYALRLAAAELSCGDHSHSRLELRLHSALPTHPTHLEWVVYPPYQEWVVYPPRPWSKPQPPLPRRLASQPLSQLSRVLAQQSNAVAVIAEPRSRSSGAGVPQLYVPGQPAKSAVDPELAAQLLPLSASVAMAAEPPRALLVTAVLRSEGPHALQVDKRPRWLKHPPAPFKGDRKREQEKFFMWLRKQQRWAAKRAAWETRQRPQQFGVELPLFFAEHGGPLMPFGRQTLPLDKLVQRTTKRLEHAQPSALSRKAENRRRGAQRTRAAQAAREDRRFEIGEAERAAQAQPECLSDDEPENADGESAPQEEKSTSHPLFSVSDSASFIDAESEALLSGSEDDDVPDISEAVEAALRAQAEQQQECEEKEQGDFDAEEPQPEQEEVVWYDDSTDEYAGDYYFSDLEDSTAVQLKQRDQSALGTRCTLNSQRTRKQQKAEQHDALVQMRAVRSQVRAEQKAAAAAAQQGPQQQPSALHPLRAVNRKAQRAATAASIAAAHTPALLSARAMSPSARSKGQQRRVDAAAATPRETARKERHAAQAARSAVKAARKLPSLVTERGAAAEEAAGRYQRQRAKSQQHRPPNPLLRADRQILPLQDRDAFLLHHAAAPVAHSSFRFRRHFHPRHPALQQLRAVSHELQVVVQRQMEEHVANPRVTNLLTTTSPYALRDVAQMLSCSAPQGGHVLSRVDLCLDSLSPFEFYPESLGELPHLLTKQFQLGAPSGRSAVVERHTQVLMVTAMLRPVEPLRSVKPIHWDAVGTWYETWQGEWAFGNRTPICLVEHSGPLMPLGRQPPRLNKQAQRTTKRLERAQPSAVARKAENRRRSAHRTRVMQAAREDRRFEIDEAERAAQQQLECLSDEEPGDTDGESASDEEEEELQPDAATRRSWELAEQYERSPMRHRHRGLLAMGAIVLQPKVKRPAVASKRAACKQPAAPRSIGIEQHCEHVQQSDETRRARAVARRFPPSEQQRKHRRSHRTKEKALRRARLDRAQLSSGEGIGSFDETLPLVSAEEPSVLRDVGQLAAESNSDDSDELGSDGEIKEDDDEAAAALSVLGLAPFSEQYEDAFPALSVELGSMPQKQPQLELDASASCAEWQCDPSLAATDCESIAAEGDAAGSGGSSDTEGDKPSWLDELLDELEDDDEAEEDEEDEFGCGGAAVLASFDLSALPLRKSREKAHIHRPAKRPVKPNTPCARQRLRERSKRAC